MTQQVGTVPEVLALLDELDEQLPDSKLASLAVFNRAYGVVTRAIKAASDGEYFANPEFIETFSICFANHYFQAVADMREGTPGVAYAWMKIVEPIGAGTKGRSASVALLMGANAHINYDLPLALAQVMDEDKLSNMLIDIVKIDSLLMKSGKEILGTYDEASPIWRFVKRRCRWLYFRPTMWMILYWRVVAWGNYKLLAHDAGKVTILTKRSTRIARRLDWFGRRFT